MTMQTIASEHARAPKLGNLHDQDYIGYLSRVQARFLTRIANGEPLFTTDAAGLWEAHLDSFPNEHRQFHTCNACKRFIENFGGLVVIASDGTTTPAIWHEEDAGPEELEAARALAKLVRRAKVTGPFLSEERVWGQPVTGEWRHLSVEQPAARLYPKRAALNASQAMAEKRQDFATVSRALDEYNAPAVHQALALLKSEALFRGEKVLGPCQFLADLHAAAEANKHRRANIIWLAVARAPAGFCHPRSSMIGTLLDDIAAGVPFEQAARSFRLKMDPLQYQRPQAAPSAGNIAAAEKLVEKLGVGPSLVRRFARLEELQTVWLPAPTSEAAPAAGGVFGHLKPKGSEPAPSMTAPPQVMTWAKFSSSILPEAKALEFWVPSSGNFTAILTAANADAPPILQWDNEQQRNPFSTYVYHRGSAASRWGLSPGGFLSVTGIVLQPHQWFGGTFAHQGRGVILVLAGAVDSFDDAGNAIFPETLKSELHAIRSTVEAYSRTAKIQGRDQASACGYGISANGPADVRLRVTNAHGVRSEVRIDRWE